MKTGDVADIVTIAVGALAATIVELVKSGALSPEGLDEIGKRHPDLLPALSEYPELREASARQRLADRLRSPG